MCALTIEGNILKIIFYYYSFLDEEEYIVNLIDSPGHVDFSSEASTGILLFS